MPGGRPVEYDPAICERLPEMFKDGQSVTEVATELGFNRSTLYDWKEKYPEFSNALEYGIQISKAWWERQGREGLYKVSEYDGESKTSTSKAINDKVWAKNMSCRFPEDWRERHDVNLTGGVQLTRIEDDIPKPRKD